MTTGSLGAGILSWERLGEGGGSPSYSDFYAIQRNKDERGYNYDGTQNLPFDQVAVSQTLAVADLAAAVIGGQLHFEFALNLNQSSGYPYKYISLDRVILFTTSSGPIRVTSEQQLGSLGTQVYDSGAGNAVLLDADRVMSGDANMYFYLPYSTLMGAAMTDTVYLYSKFGDFQSERIGEVNGIVQWESNDGYESWAIDQNAPPVPEPLPLAGSLLCAALVLWRTFKRKPQQSSEPRPSRVDSNSDRQANEEPGPSGAPRRPEEEASFPSDTRFADWEARLQRIRSNISRSPYRQGFRERLEWRLKQHQFWHFLVIHPGWSSVVLCLLLAGPVAGFSVLKLWRVTPAHFTPTIRVNLLDLAQARMLSRSAERFSAAGDKHQAVAAWQNASGNNPGSIEIARSHLSAVIQLDRPSPAQALRALTQAERLLRLTATNRTDIGRAARVFARFERWSDVVRLFERNRDELSLDEEELYVTALFNTGQHADFVDLWERRKEPFSSKPELVLYRAAYQAGWGPLDTRKAGWRQIYEAADRADQRVLASRMLLLLYRQSLDLSSYEEVLERLRNARADRLSDHLGHCRLLWDSGQVNRARELAEQARLKVFFPWDVLDVAKVLIDFDQRDLAVLLLRSHINRLGNSTEPWALSVWMLYSNLLIEQRDWDELLMTVAQLRQARRALTELRGFAWFLEGRARQAQGYFALADSAFQAAAGETYPLAELGLAVANTFLQLNRHDLAQTVLEPLEPYMGKDLRYWTALSEAARHQRAEPLLLYRATRKAYELAPREPALLNNYVAAMLVNSLDPRETCAATLELALREPDDIRHFLNHSLALAMTARYSEARRMLDSINPAALSQNDRLTYYLASFEINAQEKHIAAAKRDFAAIDLDLVFPDQRRRLWDLRMTLGARG